MDLNIIDIDGIDYVSCDKVMELAPLFSKKSINSRNLVKNKFIPDDMYTFARSSDNKRWVKSDGISVKHDKILLKYEYLKNIPEIYEKINIEDAQITDFDANGIIDTEDIDKPLVEQNQNQDQDQNEEIPLGKGREAPPIIHLKNNEKFKDAHGKILEIETRGTKKYKDIYFKVKDVEKYFDIQDVQKKQKQDYVSFTCKRSQGKSLHKELLNKESEEYFLSYHGLIKLLFTLGLCMPEVDKMTEQMTEQMFISQMRTRAEAEPEPEPLNQTNGSDEVMGIRANIFKNVIIPSTSPCFYLLTLGRVESLHESMKIDIIDIVDKDDMIVCKYGYTDCMLNQIDQCMEKFKEIKNVDLRIKYYAIIDSMDANLINQIDNMFNRLGKGLGHGFDNLIIIKPLVLETIGIKCSQIINQHRGADTNIHKQIEDMSRGIEMLKKDTKISLLEKDLEIQKLKNQFLSLQK